MDPIEEDGGLMLYGFVGNDGVNDRDPFGLTNVPGDYGWESYNQELEGWMSAGLLVGPGTGEFWDDTGYWNATRRDQWFKKFKRMYKTKIDSAAKKHCVPKRLLAAIIANERIDQGSLEASIKASTPMWLFWRLYNRGRSIGVAQVWMTGDRWGVWGNLRRRKLLLNDDYNIEAAAEVVKQYITAACKAANLSPERGGFNRLFITQTAGKVLSSKYTSAQGSQYSELCCSQDCDKLYELIPSAGLLDLMGSVWNSSPGVWSESDYGEYSKRKAVRNAYLNGKNVSELKGLANDW
ncbi:MAG: hypothetical protein A2283_11485 [Lentisphaerae bacterium RIFOXYA12_FULL_48_11]|nr:MAG: hypothetical protein A2283_11485 [Lentisphaerae bacterium RIFOXYA12_FULL_48_11]